MHEVLVNGLGGLSLPRKRVVRLTDHSGMTLDVYCARKTTTQQQQPFELHVVWPSDTERKMTLSESISLSLKTRLMTLLLMMLQNMPGETSSVLA